MHISLLLFLVSLLSNFCYADIPDETLLKFFIQSIPQGLPKDWTISNISTYCFWEGIKCGIDKNNNTKLQIISLPNSNLTGTLPNKGWRDASFLTTVELSNNFIYGSLPSELLLLPRGQLYLENNDLTGNLPSAPGSSLVVLRLQFNRFTGCIPSDWSSIKSLCTNPLCSGLNLTGNYFNCSDPFCMANLPLPPSVGENQTILSFCPAPFYICPDGQFCWNIPPTIVLYITLASSGFIVGILAMFLAAKYIDMGLGTKVNYAQI